MELICSPYFPPLAPPLLWSQTLLETSFFSQKTISNGVELPGGRAGVNGPGGPVQKQIDDKVIVAIGDTSLRGCDTSKTTTHLSFIEWQFP